MSGSHRLPRIAVQAAGPIRNFMIMAFIRDIKYTMPAHDYSTLNVYDRPVAIVRRRVESRDSHEGAGMPGFARFGTFHVLAVNDSGARTAWKDIN